MKTKRSIKTAKSRVKKTAKPKVKKAAKARVKKAVKAKKPLEKTPIKAPVRTGSATRGIAAPAVATVSRLTKEMLDRRQQAKSSVRKQGGVQMAELSEQKLATLSRSIEAGPTKAE